MVKYKARQSKGIFCIEGLWSENLSLKESVEPILVVLKQVSDVPFIYRTAATTGELKYWLKRYPKYTRYPILYLGFHGYKGSVALEDGDVTLADLSLDLERKCKNRIVHFGACKTILAKAAVRKFIETTGALAVTGYGRDVDWVESAAFDLLLFAQLQPNAFTKSGIEAVHKRIMTRYNNLADTLQYEMITRWSDAS